MEKVQGLPYGGKDGPTIQVWPAPQHDFFEAQTRGIVTEKGLLDSRPTGNFMENVTGSSHPLQLPWQLTQVDHRDGDPSGTRDWSQSWEWDSLALTAQPTTSGFKRAAPSRWAGRESEFSSPSPSENLEANGAQREPILLEFGLNSSLRTGSEDDGLLDLKLGGTGVSGCAGEGSPSSKRSRHSPSETQQTRCQVDNCSDDLQNAKDYHRRHKVCEFHSKAPKALVGTLMQRFCQQCSRFHLLKEFDDDRRSCRKRLAGHNRRRRKNQSDAATAIAYLLGDQTVLPSIINPLAQQQGRDELEKLLQEQTLVQTLVNARANVGNAETKRLENASQNNLLSAISKSQLLNSLLLSNTSIGCNVPVAPGPVDTLISALSTALLASLPQLQKGNTDMGNGGAASVRETVHPQEHSTNAGAQTVSRQNESVRFSTKDQPSNHVVPKAIERRPILPTTPPGYSDKSNSSNEDSLDERLQYDEHQRVSREGITQQSRRPQIVRNGETPSVRNLQTAGVSQTRESQCLSPDDYPSPQKDHVDSRVGFLDHSPDNGFDKQEHTGSLWFKIFDKDPADIPSTIRRKILKWLDHRPLDVEGHIKPGCIILTIYVCMPMHAWEKLCEDIEKSLQKLMSIADEDFWCKGRVLADFGGPSALIIDGKVYPRKTCSSTLVPSWVTVQPFAAVVGETVNVTVTGHNLKAPGSKIVCAFQGECTTKGMDIPSSGKEKKRDREDAQLEPVIVADGAQQQAVTFTVGPFNTTGRGFFEVEGRMWRGAAFPFIVAERTITQELCLLEKKYIENKDKRSVRPVLESSKADVFHFLHELGWLLQRGQWKNHHLRLEVPEFSNGRFTWLLRFAVEHSCCAVVRWILDLYFSTQDRSMKQTHSRAINVLSGIYLLHMAVKTKSKDMVKALVAYSPPAETDSTELKQEFLFRPDASTCDGFTALHVAASMQGADSIIDALTDAPREVWETAWTSAKDAYGRTPVMCAVSSGNEEYVEKVHNKLRKLANEESPPKEETVVKPPHVTLNISGDSVKSTSTQSPKRWLPSKQSKACSCQSRGAYSQYSLPLQIQGLNKGLMQRPFVISMLAVAAVCVCVGVLMRGAPFITSLPGPFIWEEIRFGPI